MASTGLVVVSNVKQFAKTLQSIEKYVNALYVHLNVPWEKCQPIAAWSRMISQLYMDSNAHCGRKIDMRIIVSSLRGCGVSNSLLKPVDMIFADSHTPDLCERLRAALNISSPTIYLQQDVANDVAEFFCENSTQKQKLYDSVVLGGTFDRIHVGHKIFLTQAVLRTGRRLVVGVTINEINKSKILPELILPVEQRIRDVREFLQGIDGSLEYEIVPISDPFGPTKHDPDMDLIVVSAETLRGGKKVNEVRVENNLRPLEIYAIEIIQDTKSHGPKESKISSSNTRIDLLGTRLRQPEPRPQLFAEPYIIGLTGGIASGKSMMCSRLTNKGALILDCDKIAHEIYEPGQVCYDKIIKHFGKDILETNRRIDRAKLGAIVFNNPKKMEDLNAIVWPELLVEVKRRIRDLHEKHQCKVVVIEAAILFRAGWENECHEVWGLMVPHDLAVQRIMKRNNLSEEDAQKRIASQVHNDEIVAKSNIVFSSQWDDEFTTIQLDKAWCILMRDLELKQAASRL